MAELGATADASTPYLRDLNASAGQLTRFLDNLGPFAESSRVNVRTLAKTADKARPAIASARPTVAELTKTTEHAPELANNLAIVLKRPRRPQPRRREGQALAGRPGLHGLRGGPPIHLRPDAGHQHLRRERPHPQGQPLRLGVQRLPERRLRQAQGEAGARASSAAASPRSARTSRASPPPTRPTPASTTPARRARRPPRRAKSKSKTGASDKDKSKNAPGQPDLKKALEKLLKGGGGGNKPSVRPSLPNVHGPERPRSRTSRAAVPRRPERRRRAVHAAGSPGPPRLPPRAHERPRRILRVRQPRARGRGDRAVVIVAVFLSYNANQGLPFVPTTTLKVRFANGAEPRQGQRDPLRRLPRRRGRGHEAGQAVAPARSAPSSSSSSTRRSARSRRTRAGASARARRSASSTSSSTRATRRRRSRTATPSRSSRPTINVDLDEVFKMFDAKTRARQPGEPARLRRLVRRPRRRRRAHGRGGAAPASSTSSRSPRNLADPETELPRFFKELGDAARIVAPISKTNARLFTTMADTWEARRARPGGAAARRSPRARRRWTRRSSRSASSARSSPS